MTVKHLIKKPTDWKVQINNNMIWQSAYYVENQLISAGAKAGTDYNILDCFKLGVEFCVSARLDDLTNKINTINGSVIDSDIDDGVEDISDSGKAKPKTKVPFIIGYQQRRM
jgi:hypothetical protein